MGNHAGQRKTTNFTKHRIAFMGTPEFAIPTLDALTAAGHDVAAVYTRPPARSGRGSRLIPSPVHRRAEELGIEVLTPASLRGPEQAERLRGIGADIAVVAAYGHILPRSILDVPPLGCVNVHASLLPRWRGAAPIQRAMLAGDAETGVTIIRMDPGMDTGDMLAVETMTMLGMTAGEVHVALAAIGARLVTSVLADPAAHPAIPQPVHGVTIAPKIDKAEAVIDFTRPASEIERMVRAFNPAPGAWTEIAGERVRVLRCDLVAASGTPGEVIDARLTIACSQGAIRPTLVQRAGRGTSTGSELAHAMGMGPATASGMGRTSWNGGLARRWPTQ